MNGILPLWKEKGMTSHDCVFKLRKLLRTKKIGHTGTLDPDVDGVLPICVGSATKMVEYIQDSKKTYRGQITLGIATTTEDASGEIIAQKVVNAPIDTAIIAQKMVELTGEIIQIPPMYSAVKVNGKRLYEYARLNQSVERPKRQVTIYHFKQTSDVVYENDCATWSFEVSCSKGTYVRTLAVDLGEKLGYPAHMSALTRVESGGFTSEQCLTLAQIDAVSQEERQSLLLPIEKALVDYDRYEITDDQMAQVKNGAVLLKIEHVTYPLFLTYHQQIVALYDNHPYDETKIKPKKMMLGNLNASC